MKLERKLVTSEEIENIFKLIGQELKARVDKKGPYAYIGSHEALGIITEEYYELIEGVKANDRENVKEELMDILIGCLWGLASL